MFVKNGDYVENIVFKSEQVVIQQTQQGTSNQRCYIIGNGNSMTINENTIVIEHDPVMSYYIPKISKKYSAYVFYYTFNADLISAGKDIAKFLETISKDYNQYFLVGHSKCSITLYTTAFIYKNPHLITLTTVSAPVFGTVIADKNFVHEILKNEGNEDELNKIREEVNKYMTEGDLRREVNMNIKTKMEINSYQGTRHKKGLPVRGQRTNRNARTRKGKGKVVANKKK